MGKIIRNGITLASFNYEHDDRLITKTITANDTYNASDDNADGYSSVTVNVQPTLITKTITESGTYDATDDNADGYSEVTVNISSIPSGTHIDPWNTNTAYTTNIALAISFYEIVSGELSECVLLEVAPASGYEGICIEMPSDANLASGTNYELSFILDVSNATFESSNYPFGVAHSTSQITNFNRTPDVSFAKQSGTQSITLPFTAGANNYLSVLLAQLKSTRAIIKLSNLQFVEVT